MPRKVNKFGAIIKQSLKYFLVILLFAMGILFTKFILQLPNNAAWTVLILGVVVIAISLVLDFLSIKDIMGVFK